MNDNSETFAVFITGLASEAEALQLTNALLKIQQQRETEKPVWTRLRFRPVTLTGHFAKELLDKWPQVILHSRGSARLANPPPLAATGAPAVADERRNLPTLKRVDTRSASTSARPGR